MFNQILQECIQKSEECINTSELLINLNSEQHVFQWKKRTQEAISFYNSMIEQFEKLITECNKTPNNSLDCKELTIVSKDIINQCKNMINQCGAIPTDRILDVPASKIQIVQSILPQAAACIETCEKFLSLYNK
ncbi:MAG: hypothetical protein P4L22_00760 [Candidatus Babeliales bacterium]|nr:hypothetical protein [Candidatus Babeliales bacterium]